MTVLLPCQTLLIVAAINISLHDEKDAVLNKLTWKKQPIIVEKNCKHIALLTQKGGALPAQGMFYYSISNGGYSSNNLKSIKQPIGKYYA
ncbi:hypothetical protein VQ643_15170 [Pseudomonas sp. F1_0610]|uniref:hypothetical protein n=1 Tax=Pseudomonas sp. F1_0610 TaxID=3114284 RepID=UPI0039C2FE03